MKKTLIAVIGLALVGTVLVGCSKEAAPTDGTKQSSKTPDGSGSGPGATSQTPTK